MRRGGGAIRVEGRVPARPDRETLGRLADARQAGGPAAARAEPAAARRADELPRPAHSDFARTFPAWLRWRLPDRLPRPDVSQRHLRPHARPVARPIDFLPRQGGRLPGVRARAAGTRRTLERGD